MRKNSSLRICASWRVSINPTSLLRNRVPEWPWSRIPWKPYRRKWPGFRFWASNTWRPKKSWSNNKLMRFCSKSATALLWKNINFSPRWKPYIFKKTGWIWDKRVPGSTLRIILPRTRLRFSNWTQSRVEGTRRSPKANVRPHNCKWSIRCIMIWRSTLALKWMKCQGTLGSFSEKKTISTTML